MEEISSSNFAPCSRWSNSTKRAIFVPWRGVGNVGAGVALLFAAVFAANLTFDESSFVFGETAHPRAFGLTLPLERMVEVVAVAKGRQPALYADFDGYAIKPHPDTRRKVLTMLIYMPEDDSQRHTTVYKISPMGVFAWKSCGLVKEKTAPFLPNSGFAFVVIHPRHNLLHASWHGRDTISIDNSKPRMTILNTYYAKPPKAGEVEHEYR